jgi:integrase
MRKNEVKVVRPTGRENFVLRWLDPLTGQLRQLSTDTSVRRKADQMAKEKELELATTEPVDDQITWAQFRTRYENEVLVELADQTWTTFAAAANSLERICKPKRLVDVDASTLSRYAAARRKAGKAIATVAQNIRHLRAAMNWAVIIGLLDKAPKYHAPKREKGKHGLMRGRPITDAEFQRMYAACPLVRPDDYQDWQAYLTGMWLSGLRASEGVSLSWDNGDFVVDLTGRHPRFRIFAEGQKAHRDEYCPMTPDFAEFLLATPEDVRRGRVFRVSRFLAGWVKCVVGRIGERAGVIVDAKKEQFAGCHSLRKSFGTRWARRVKPPVLQRLMRHAHIQTTMQFYVAIDADDIADEVWGVHESRAIN